MPRGSVWILQPLALHANYLVSLASPDPEIRAKSNTSFRGKLDRAALPGADYLVLHPGTTKAIRRRASARPLRTKPDA